MSEKDKRRSGAMKGQMFMIGAIIIVTALVLIKTSIDVTEILEKKRFLEAGVERIEFANLRYEVPKAAYNSLNASVNMTNATNGFIAYTESKLAGKLVQLDGATFTIYYPNITASTNSNINVTFYNFFDTDVSRVIANFSANYNQPQNFSNVPAGQTRSFNFTVNTASSTNMSLWVFYEVGSESVTENITIPIDLVKTRFVGYYDIRMTSERGTLRDRFVDTVNVN